MGAEEGIYTLNLTELHENAMDLLYPRRTVWMFVIKDVLMTLSGTKAYSTQHTSFVENPLHYGSFFFHFWTIHTQYAE